MIEEIIANLEELSPFLAMILGLTIGLQHAFDPDHIAAISTQITKGKSEEKSTKKILKSLFTKSSILGVFWGAGHTTTLVLIGIAMFYFAIRIPENIYSSFEILVGVMLVCLGILSIWRYKQGHRHPHQHKDGSVHFDFHKHEDSEHKHSHTSYLIGMIHGLAGSGILIVLVSSSLNSYEMIASLILFFGVGTIIGMSAISGLLGFPLVLAKRFLFLPFVFRIVTSFASIGIGLSIFYNVIAPSFL